MRKLLLGVMLALFVASSTAATVTGTQIVDRDEIANYSLDVKVQDDTQKLDLSIPSNFSYQFDSQTNNFNSATFKENGDQLVWSGSQIADAGDTYSVGFELESGSIGFYDFNFTFTNTKGSKTVEQHTVNSRNIRITLNLENTTLYLNDSVDILSGSIDKELSESSSDSVSNEAFNFTLDGSSLESKLDLTTNDIGAFSYTFDPEVDPGSHQLNASYISSNGIFGYENNSFNVLPTTNLTTSVFDYGTTSEIDNPEVRIAGDFERDWDGTDITGAGTDLTLEVRNSSTQSVLASKQMNYNSSSSRYEASFYPENQGSFDYTITANTSKTVDGLEYDDSQKSGSFTFNDPTALSADTDDSQNITDVDSSIEIRGVFTRLWNGTSVDPSETDLLLTTRNSSNSNIFLDNATMTYDSGDSRWEYSYNPPEPGTYDYTIYVDSTQTIENYDLRNKTISAIFEAKNITIDSGSDSSAIDPGQTTDVFGEVTLRGPDQISTSETVQQWIDNSFIQDLSLNSTRQFETTYSSSTPGKKLFKFNLTSTEGIYGFDKLNIDVNPTTDLSSTVFDIGTTSELDNPEIRVTGDYQQSWDGADVTGGDTDLTLKVYNASTSSQVASKQMNYDSDDSRYEVSFFPENQGNYDYTVLAKTTKTVDGLYYENESFSGSFTFDNPTELTPGTENPANVTDIDSSITVTGELTRLWDGTEASNSETDMLLTVQDPDSNTVLTDKPMSYDAGDSRWEYSFNPSKLGTYTYTVQVDSTQQINNYAFRNKTRSGQFNSRNVSITASLNESKISPSAKTNLSGTVDLLVSDTSSQDVQDRKVGIWIGSDQIFKASSITKTNSNGFYTNSFNYTPGKHDVKINVTNANGVSGVERVNLTIFPNTTITSDVSDISGRYEIDAPEIIISADYETGWNDSDVTGSGTTLKIEVEDSSGTVVDQGTMNYRSASSQYNYTFNPTKQDNFTYRVYANSTDSIDGLEYENQTISGSFTFDDPTAFDLNADFSEGVFEKGRVQTHVSGYVEVPLENTYTNPVVLTAGQEGADSGMDVEASRPVIRGKTSNSFDVKVVNDREETVSSTVAYAVMEEGHYVADGVEVEAGTQFIGGGYDAENTNTVFFQEDFGTTPIVTDTFQNSCSGRPVSTRYVEGSFSVGSYDYWVEDYFGSSESSWSCSGDYGYIAVEEGSSSESFEASEIESCSEDPDTGAWCQATFSNSYDAEPFLFHGLIQASGGEKTVTGIKSLSASSVLLRPTESRVPDSEQGHATNDIPWIAWSARKPVDVDSSATLTAELLALWDGENFDDSSTSVDVSVIDESDSSVIVDNQSMNYDAGQERWEYTFNPPATGDYRYNTYLQTSETSYSYPVKDRTGSGYLSSENISVSTSLSETKISSSSTTTISGTVEEVLSPTTTEAVENDEIEVWTEDGYHFTPGNNVQTNSNGDYSYTFGYDAGEHRLNVNYSSVNGISGEKDVNITILPNTTLTSTTGDDFKIPKIELSTDYETEWNFTDVYGPGTTVNISVENSSGIVVSEGVMDYNSTSGEYEYTFYPADSDNFEMNVTANTTKEVDNLPYENQSLTDTFTVNQTTNLTIGTLAPNNVTDVNSTIDLYGELDYSNGTPVSNDDTDLLLTVRDTSTSDVIVQNSSMPYDSGQNRWEETFDPSEVGNHTYEIYVNSTQSIFNFSIVNRSKSERFSSRNISITTDLNVTEADATDINLSGQVDKIYSQIQSAPVANKSIGVWIDGEKYTIEGSVDTNQNGAYSTVLNKNPGFYDVKVNYSSSNSVEGVNGTQFTVYPNTTLETDVTDSGPSDVIDGPEVFISADYQAEWNGSDVEGGDTSVDVVVRDSSDTVVSSGSMTYDSSASEYQYTFYPSKKDTFTYSVEANSSRTVDGLQYENQTLADSFDLQNYTSLNVKQNFSINAISGTLTVDSGTWRTVSYDNYGDPVVVATAGNTGNGNGLITEVRNLGSDSAEVRVCDSSGSDGCEASTGHELNYLAVDAAAVNSLSGVEAGTFTAEGGIDSSTTPVTYSESFGSAPVPFTTVQTDNGASPVDSRATGTDTSGFTGSICHQNGTDNCDSGHVQETVGYIAIEPGNNPFPTSEVGTSGNTISSSNWYSVSFSTSFSETPVGLAATLTNNGNQEPEIDEVRNVDTSGMEIRYCELQSGDNCDGHTSENVGYFAISPGEYNLGSDIPVIDVNDSIRFRGNYEMVWNRTMLEPPESSLSLVTENNQGIVLDNSSFSFNGTQWIYEYSPSEIGNYNYSVYAESTREIFNLLMRNKTESEKFKAYNAEIEFDFNQSVVAATKPVTFTGDSFVVPTGEPLEGFLEFDENGSFATQVFSNATGNFSGLIQPETAGYRQIRADRQNNGLKYEWYDTQTLYNNEGHPSNASEMADFFDNSTSGVSFGGQGNWSPREIGTDGINWHSGGNLDDEKPEYLPGDGYSWTAKGEIYIPETGSYNFSVDSDDASQVLIDGSVVVAWYGGHGLAGSPDYTAHTNDTTLTKGWHDFEARMEEGNGGDGLAVGWLTPSNSSFNTIDTKWFRATRKDYKLDGVEKNVLRVQPNTTLSSYVYDLGVTPELDAPAIKFKADYENIWNGSDVTGSGTYANLTVYNSTKVVLDQQPMNYNSTNSSYQYDFNPPETGDYSYNITATSKRTAAGFNYERQVVSGSITVEKTTVLEVDTEDPDNYIEVDRNGLEFQADYYKIWNNESFKDASDVKLTIRNSTDDVVLDNASMDYNTEGQELWRYDYDFSQVGNFTADIYGTTTDKDFGIAYENLSRILSVDTRNISVDLDSNTTYLETNETVNFNGSAVLEPVDSVSNGSELDVFFDGSRYFGDTFDFESGTGGGWVYGGGADWFRTSNYAYEGSYSFRAGDIGAGNSSWVERNINGPRNISFYWKASSEACCDKLQFYIDGSLADEISGSTSWVREEFNVSSGNHTLRWEYFKDQSVTPVDVEDTGFVDLIKIRNPLETDSQGRFAQNITPPAGKFDFTFNVTNEDNISGQNTTELVIWANTTLNTSEEDIGTTDTLDAPLVHIRADYNKIWDGKDVNSSNADVKVSVRDATDTVVIDNATMSYNSSISRYDYDFKPAEPGNYTYTVYAGSSRDINGVSLENESATGDIDLGNLTTLEIGTSDPQNTVDVDQSTLFITADFRKRWNDDPLSYELDNTLVVESWNSEGELFLDNASMSYNIFDNRWEKEIDPDTDTLETYNFTVYAQSSNQYYNWSLNDRKKSGEYAVKNISVNISSQDIIDSGEILTVNGSAEILPEKEPLVYEPINLLFGGKGTSNLVESFEDNDLIGYNNQQNVFTSGSAVREGDYGITTIDSNMDGVMWRDDVTVSRGEALSAWVFPADGDVAGFAFGVQGDNTGYTALINRTSEQLQLRENGTVIASENYSFGAQWYQLQAIWPQTGNITVRAFGDSGEDIKTRLTVQTNTFSSGNVGWFLESNGTAGAPKLDVLRKNEVLTDQNGEFTASREITQNPGNHTISVSISNFNDIDGQDSAEYAVRLTLDNPAVLSEYNRSQTSVHNDEEAFANVTASNSTNGPTDRVWAELRPETVDSGSLEFYYKLDEEVSGTGGAVEDVTLNNQDGVARGGVETYKQGRFRRAFRFDEQGYIEIPDGNYPNQEITVSAWIRLNSYGGSIFNNHDNDSMNLGVAETGELFFQTKHGSQDSVANLTTGYTLPKNEWVRVTGVFSSSAGEKRVYVDQNRVGYSTQSLLDQDLSGSASEFVVGRNYDLKSLNGSIDQVKVWNKALKDADIERVHYSRVYLDNTTRRNLTHVWKGTFGTETELEDIVGTHTAYFNSNDSTGLGSEIPAPKVQFSIDCAPPHTGNWTLNSSCTMDETDGLPQDLLLESNKSLNMAANVTLGANLSSQSLRFDKGSNITFQPGAKVW